MKNKDTNKKAKSRDEYIENLREEHKQSLGRILEFIEQKIKDISGSMKNRVSHAALLSAMTAWTIKLETSITKEAAATADSSTSAIVKDFVNESTNRASDMAVDSINKLIDSLSSAQAAAVMSIITASTDNNKLKGIYASNTKYNDPGTIKMSNEFRNAFSTELVDVTTFVDHQIYGDVK